jgi:hypothetical protein
MDKIHGEEEKGTYEFFARRLRTCFTAEVFLATECTEDTEGEGDI